MFHNRYDESLDILYSNTMFQFDDLKVLRQFLDLSLRSGTDIFVRSIYFDWVSFVWFDYGSQIAAQAYVNEYWYPVCQRFTEMRGLRDLWVAIQPGKMYKTVHDFDEIDYFQPLRRITNLRFVLERHDEKCHSTGLSRRQRVESGDITCAVPLSSARD